MTTFSSRELRKKNPTAYARRFLKLNKIQQTAILRAEELFDELDSKFKKLSPEGFQAWAAADARATGLRRALVWGELGGGRRAGQ